MFEDEREETLREVSALGNLKAVQHFAKSGVNLNSQNKMNGWTALHWAAHRGHEPVVRALLSNGADPSLKTNKGQTALDLAQKHATIAEILERAARNRGINIEDRHDPEPELPIVPAYMKDPDLQKSWLHPDEFTDAKTDRTSQATEVEPETPSQKQTAPASSPQPQPAAQASVEEREILVYLSTRSDENILGSVFLRNESISASVENIKQELDGLPDAFTISRNNGKVNIPISTKQMDKRLLDIFRGEDDALVIVPKTQ